MMSGTNQPVKVAVFAESSLSGSTIEMLVNQQLFAGAVLPQQLDMFTQQLAGALQQATLNVAQFDHAQLDELDNLLTRWEANVVLCFGFSQHMAEIVTKVNLPVFHCAVGEGKYSGPQGIYWQVRDQQDEGLAQIGLWRLQQSQLVYQRCISQSFKIDSKDTAQCVENALLQGLPSLVHQLIGAWSSDSLMFESVEWCDDKALVLTEQDLAVDWHCMPSQQICAMARAGNPRFGGCSVKINNTVINLLQATKVNYPTYGVEAGMIVCNSEKDGVIVATVDGAIRIDILSNADGVFTGLQFFERFGIYAGMTMS